MRAFFGNASTVPEEQAVDVDNDRENNDDNDGGNDDDAPVSTITYVPFEDL